MSTIDIILIVIIVLGVAGGLVEARFLEDAKTAWEIAKK